MRLSLRSIALAMVATCVPACKQRYTSPCTVSAAVAIEVAGADAQVRDAGVLGGPAFALVDAPSGEIVAVRQVLAPVPDAGAPDAAVLGAQLGSTPIPAAVEVVVVDRAGAARRSKLAAPAALAARRGSTTTIGAVWTGAGVVWHWVETTTTTAPDGVVDTTSALHFVFVGEDGHESRAVAPNTTCAGCTFAVSVATTATGALALYDGVATLPPAGPSVAAHAPSFVAFSRDGTIADSGSASWLGAGGAARLRSAGDRTIVIRGTAIWSVDDRAQPIAGPVRLPFPVGVAAWWGNGGDIAFAWPNVAAAPLSGAQEAAEPALGGTSVGAETDILLERGNDRGVVDGVARVTTGGSAQDITRDAEGTYGILTSSLDGDVFVLVDAGGHKLGGDVAVGGETASVGNHVLRAPSPRTFVDVRASGSSLTRREITCAR
ncbi:MAG: hypothetical protein JWM74_4923 [Myxococcaceae bacterium]|nr:hypothetical protein [Myxococcaceae bacterium]